jgi:hypothetical protein
MSINILYMKDKPRNVLTINKLATFKYYKLNYRTVRQVQQEEKKERTGKVEYTRAFYPPGAFYPPPLCVGVVCGVSFLFFFSGVRF